ncbi:MAG: ferredoxin family protein, partial [Acidilobaceae archaeon]
MVSIPIRGRTPFNVNRVLRPRGRPHINNDVCKGCGFCIEFCPIGVLEFS